MLLSKLNCKSLWSGRQLRVSNCTESKSIVKPQRAYCAKPIWPNNKTRRSEYCSVAKRFFIQRHSVHPSVCMHSEDRISFSTVNVDLFISECRTPVKTKTSTSTHDTERFHLSSLRNDQFKLTFGARGSFSANPQWQWMLGWEHDVLRHWGHFFDSAYAALSCMNHGKQLPIMLSELRMLPGKVSIFRLHWPLQFKRHNSVARDTTSSKSKFNLLLPTDSLHLLRNLVIQNFSLALTLLPKVTNSQTAPLSSAQKCSIGLYDT